MNLHNYFYMPKLELAAPENNAYDNYHPLNEFFTSYA